MRREPRTDVPSLVAGLGIVGLGILVLLDEAGTLELRFGVLAPVTCAVLGAVLLAIGWTRQD